MSIYFDQTAATAITKIKYTKKEIQTLCFSSPALGLMPKKTDEGGQAYYGALNYALMSTVSSSDSIAFTQGNPSKYSQFQCQWAFGYASANCTGTAIDQTKGEENAMVDLIVKEAKNGFLAIGQKLGFDLWGYGGGAMGQISAGSNVGTPTITLTDVSTAIRFYAGMLLQASVDNGTLGGGTRSAGATVTLASVDTNAGTLTATGNWTAGIAAVAPGDFLFLNGGYNTSMLGIPAWIPDANNRPIVTDSFNGVNRFTTDPTRLAGVYYNGLGAPKEETLTQLSVLVNRFGGKPTNCFVNPLDYADIVKGIGTRVIVPITEKAYGAPQISFEGVRLALPSGMVNLMMDSFVPAGIAWLLNMSEWLMPSMGEVPKILDEVDNIVWLRQSGLDAYQMRIGYRATTYCAAPGHQGVCNF